MLAESGPRSKLPPFTRSAGTLLTPREWAEGALAPGLYHSACWRRTSLGASFGTLMPRAALITGITGQDGAYLAELLLGQGLHGPRHQAPDVAVQHRPHRSSVRGSARPRPALRAALRRSHRFVEPRPRDAAGAARRGLQPRRAEPRRGVVRGAGVHGQFRRDGHAAPAGGDPHPRASPARRASTRRRPRRCSGSSRKRRRRRPRRSIRARPTAWPSSTATGSPSTTARPTGSTPATASCSITNRRFAARPSSRARSPARSRASCWASQDCLYLGNLDARRDWGHARDYVRAMWLMLQQPTPEDFVIATGEQHSVRDFVTAAAAELGIGLAWEGKDADEVGRVASVAPGGSTGARNGPDRRPHRPPLLPPGRSGHAAGRCDQGAGRSSAGRRKCSFADLVAEMVREDLRAARARRARQAARPHGAQAQRWLRDRLRRHRFAR